MTNKSPGEQLRDLLKELLPLRGNTNGFVSGIDDLFKSDGELEETTYNSCINYTIRRLISTASYLKRKFCNDSYPSGKYISEIRSYLSKQTRFDRTRIEDILTLLIQCLEMKEVKLSSGIKNNLLRKQKKCYICGTELLGQTNGPQKINLSDIRGGKIDLIQNGQYFSVDLRQILDIEINNATNGAKYSFVFPLSGNINVKTVYSPYSPEVEHIWPRAMGGQTNEGNLLLACSECNQDKHDYIDASDFHYEEIALVNWDETSSDFTNELKREYKLALWSKSSFECELCGSKAQDMGRLEFIRKNPNDSWHFLNISIVCPSCYHKLSRPTNRRYIDGY